MANWQMFKITSGGQLNNSNGGYLTRLELDKNVEYANGYKSYINVNYWQITMCGYNSGKRYIEIDIDKTRCKSSSHIFNSSDVVREVPQDVVIRRNEMIRASSADPTALAITREGMDRINRGEIREFEYKMEDISGNKHHWVYRK